MFIKLIALLALVFICFGITGFLFVKKKLSPPVTAVILVTLACGTAACFLIPGLRGYINVPGDIPDTLAAEYSAAISSGDYDRVSELTVSDCGLLDLKCQDENGALLLDKLLSNISLEPVGPAEQEWSFARQSFKICFYDFDSRAEEINAAAVAGMEKRGASEPRPRVYNADKTYLEAVARQEYSKALKNAVKKDFEDYEDTIELKIVCRGGKWFVSSDEPLLDAISDALGNRRLEPDKLLDKYVEDRCEEARLSAAYVPKHFTIDFDNTVAPEPDKNRYGVTTDPAEVQRVVDGASELLAEQKLVWNQDVEIIPGSDIRYYCDDSILVIVWREERNGTAATFAEVKVADASQLRRKLVNDQYDPPTNLWKEATKLSEDVNAVLATGSDLYAFRWQGIFSYGGMVYRSFTNYVQSCHITRSGDMLFTDRYEINSIKEAQKYVTDNDIMFTLAFGPVLVKDGEPWITYDYAIGEIFEEYARAAMGQLGELHYLMTVMSKDDKYDLMRNPTLVEMQNLMVETGCVQAYALDGGQTAAVIIDNEMITRPTYGWERIYCDILYFATAIPEEERLG